MIAATVVCLLTSCYARHEPPLKTPQFDQDRAYRRLAQLCSIGPRNHGSESKTRAEQWIQQSLRDAGAEVEVHEFSHTASGTTDASGFRNIVGRFRPAETRRVMIATHYDTRSTADRDPDPARRNDPIMGANDGGSGVAVLLEMAAVWKDHPPPVGVDLIFFDGEDFGKGNEWGDYFLGSKAWLRDHADYRPEWGVVLDMVGDALLRIRKERRSLSSAPEITERLWNAARRVEAHALVNETGGQIFDDHNAFLDRGIPVVLLIDFQYPWFHTTGDTPDKCSAASLGQVGRTVMEAVEAR